MCVCEYALHVRLFDQLVNAGLFLKRKNLNLLFPMGIFSEDGAELKEDDSTILGWGTEKLSDFWEVRTANEDGSEGEL